MNDLASILEDKFTPTFFSSATIVNPSPEMKDGKIEEHTEATPIDISQIKAIVDQLKSQVDALSRILHRETPISFAEKLEAIPKAKNSWVNEIIDSEHPSVQIIEGVFNGEKMIGSDGATYVIPPNYASKSKLVEGDFMKLTITPQGRLLYKQIGPVPRMYVTGELFLQGSNQWAVAVNNHSYRILTASVTFHKGKSGDRVTLQVPEGGQSNWGAVETILSK